MGYISVNASHSPPSVVFKSEMWIFFVLTIVVLVVTGALWLYLDSRRKKGGLQQVSELQPAGTGPALGDEKV
jgi:hypothetical protein